jgi:hypothetical protein
MQGDTQRDPKSVHLDLADRWLARGAVALIVTLQFSLITDVGFGRRWLAPTVELILLVPLTVLSLRAELIAWHAHTRRDWESAAWYRRVNLALGEALVVIISLSNARSLTVLLRALLAGSTHNGRSLLLDALNIWTTNVIVFGIWYWELDRGGPSIDPVAPRRRSEFIFPQMTLRPDVEGAGAPPTFIDYIFLSFTTSTAFSPTDTMPLTARMRLLMMLEATTSLLTLAIVAARAVNILA